MIQRIEEFQREHSRDGVIVVTVGAALRARVDVDYLVIWNPAARKVGRWTWRWTAYRWSSTRVCL